MTGPASTPAISDYAFLSDTHTAALVGPDGAVEWLCTPRFDGPSACARILDRERGGALELAVAGERTAWRYRPQTFVLESEWTSDDGTALVTDALACRQVDGDEPDGSGGDALAADHVLVRSVRTTIGTVRVRVRLDVRPDYGRQPARWSGQGGRWTEEVSGLSVRSDVPLELVDGAPAGEAELRMGEQAAVLIGYGQAPPDADLDADRLLEDTARAWRSWCEVGDYDGVAAELVERSSMVLRALSYDESGALLAAPTTSLPEELGGVRNWDYRFTWHRDASLHVLALLRLGHAGLADQYRRFLLEHCLVPGRSLLPMAGLRGEQSGEESELDHLSGYAGSRPVRIGNEAFEQVQLDSYGHVLDAVYAHASTTGELREQDWVGLRDLVKQVAADWREPDHGLWEMRGEPQHFTNSKVLAWVCLDRGIRLAEEHGLEAPLDDWRRERDAVHADVLERGWDAERGTFTMAYDEPALDASLLRIPLTGFLPGDDPRVGSTIDAIMAELGVDTDDGGALVHRYDPDQVDDGVEGGEGAFLLCSFELVSALVLAGRPEEARARFDRLIQHVGPLGLLSEEMDATGAYLGNYPQAFTHLGLIEAAVNLTDAGDGEALHAWAARRQNGSGG